MNTIQRYILFYDLAVINKGYSFDPELLKTRELNIFGIATIAFTTLSLTFLNSAKIITFSITPLNIGIYTGIFLVSLVFSK